VGIFEKQFLHRRERYSGKICGAVVLKLGSQDIPEGVKMFGWQF